MSTPERFSASTFRFEEARLIPFGSITTILGIISVLAQVIASAGYGWIILLEQPKVGQPSVGPHSWRFRRLSEHPLVFQVDAAHRYTTFGMASKVGSSALSVLSSSIRMISFHRACSGSESSTRLFCQ